MNFKKKNVLLYIILFYIQIGFSWAQSKDLFGKSEVLNISISGNLLDLLNDREGKAEYYPVTLSYLSDDSNIISIPARSKTRGNFRRMTNNCSFPPLFLNFSGKNDNGIFSSLDRVKLVMPCQGERYVLREYYVYKLYNLISPKSFNVRLLKVTLDDNALRPLKRGPFYAFIIEEEEQLAERNRILPVRQQLIRPEHPDLEDFLSMSVFQYLIGNTDWSIQYRQNIKLFKADTLRGIFSVPYDFDHAGIVGAPYAMPAPELKLATIKNRRYRGYCKENMDAFDEVIAFYNDLKESIYALYTESDLLEDKYIKSTVKYLDEFYEVLNNPKDLKREFQYPCKTYGTGNVVIKGLKE
jgi:hypothetical protein